MVDKSYYIQQIDLMKGLAIISVILGHTVLYNYDLQNDILSNTLQNSHTNIISTLFILQSLDIAKIGTHWITYSSLTTQQVVPIFMAIMAFNLALSYKRKDYAKVSDIYSKKELLAKARRFFIPFIIADIAIVVFGIIYYMFTHISILFLDSHLLLGFLLINGPGNYFISIIFQFVLIFPILYLIYKRYPKLTLILSFIIALLFEFIISNFSLFINKPTIYSILIIRFLPLIALSLWISEDYQLSSKRNSFIIILSILSIVYLVIVSQFQYPINLFGIVFKPYLASQNMFASFYQIFLILVGLKCLPKSKITFFELLSLIGKSSYHIFLVQVIYFGLIYAGVISLSAKYGSISDILSVRNISIIVVNLLICITLGCLFYIMDNKSKLFNNVFLKISRLGG